MKLLSVGQSLRGLTNEPSPYKISEQHFLPKFAPVGRPISLAPTKERLAQAVPVRSTVRAMAVSKPTSRTVKIETTVEGPAVYAAQRPEKIAKEETGWRSWFSFFARSKPRGRRPLVQGEMTLETLKVIRNDLSEADLEVVTAKLEPSAEPAPAANDSQASSSVWSRAAAQFSSVTGMRL